MLAWIGLLTICALIARADSAKYGYQTQFVEISVANLTTNILDWDKDLAVMFYAPWCKYCKQLAPSMAKIAELEAPNKELSVGKFNCEASDNEVKLCQQLGISQYPSVYFFGYGNFNQAPKGNIFASNKFPRMVKFNADLRIEAIYDWITMLAQISSIQRKVDDFKSFFFGKSRLTKKIERLQSENQELSYKVSLFSDELEKLKADDLFSGLDDNGDPFPIISALEPDQV